MAFISETTQIKCRICHKEMLRKNYKAHLKNVHPTENSDDTTPFSQRTISDLFSKFKKTEKTSEIDTHSETIEDITEKVGESSKRRLENVDLEEGERLKKRHESGDSGIGLSSAMFRQSLGSSGDSKTADMSKSNLMPANVTNNDLDEKLDKILQGLNELKIEKKKEPQSAQLDEIEDMRTDDFITLENNIKYARSMDQILQSGFIYDKDTSKVICSVCEDKGKCDSGEFLYPSEHGLSFEQNEFLPRIFCNLKKSVVRHIHISKTHIEAIRDLKEKERQEKLFETKNQHAGMNLGRICMKNYILGRPYTDYESDVLVLKMSGATVGELNHSRKFPASFRKSVCQVVHERVSKYLSTPLKQTGFLPPVCISADKGTYKHRSRQFLSCITIMPGGNNFVEVLTCGQPVVTKGSSGKALAENMKEGFDSFGISSKQIESGVFDGVYFHCSISKHLEELYKTNQEHVLYTWDPLHKTGLVDKDVADKKVWVTDITTICQQIFNTFNWGANYEKFREATTLWKLSLSNLVKFSETRFANSKRKVYKNIHHEFAPIITCLEDSIMAAVTNRSGEETSNARIREKGDEARTLKGKILNVDFLLLLSGLVDVYEQFGVIVQYTQMVHLLPHERYDLFTKGIGQMKKMTLCVDHKNCEILCEDKKKPCMWPKSHADKKSLKEKGTIRDIPVVDSQGIEAAGLGILTRSQTSQMRIDDDDGHNVDASILETDRKLCELVNELCVGLNDGVYSAEHVEIVEATRVVLDLPSLALSIKEEGASATSVSVLQFQHFKNAISNIPVNSLKNVPEDELKAQYRCFLERLEKLTKTLDTETLRKADSKDIIQQFFDLDNSLFKGIEMIMQALSVAAVKISCESIVESFVSRYEDHFHLKRNLNEESVNEEFEIAVNGPNLANSDSVIKEAMNRHWEGGCWHFHKTTIMEKMAQGDSTVLKRMLNTKNNLPFMG